MKQQKGQGYKVDTGGEEIHLFSWWIVLAVLGIITVLGAMWEFSHNDEPQPRQYILRQGDKFETYHDYLKLFGITDTTTYWGKVLPHHPMIVIWGPVYHHPQWHNEGDVEQMMPTITEWWEPEGTDTALVNMRNLDKYYHELRTNEVRLTFMKNLIDSSYTFLGVYRLSLTQSDSTRCVWERVADKCDLNHLEYVEELRN